MSQQKKMSGNASVKRNCWSRGNGSYSMRGELKRGIALRKKQFNRKVRCSQQAMNHGLYKRIAPAIKIVCFS